MILKVNMKVVKLHKKSIIRTNQIDQMLKRKINMKEAMLQKEAITEIKDEKCKLTITKIFK